MVSFPSPNAACVHWTVSIWIQLTCRSNIPPPRRANITFVSTKSSPTSSSPSIKTILTLRPRILKPSPKSMKWLCVCVCVRSVALECWSETSFTLKGIKHSTQQPGFYFSIIFTCSIFARGLLFEKAKLFWDQHIGWAWSQKDVSSSG